MRRILSILSLLGAFAWISCTKGGEQVGLSGDTYTVNATLTAAKVIPAVASDTSNGTLNGWYDEEGNVFSFTIRYRKDTNLIKLDTIIAVKLFKEVPASAGGSPARSFPVTIVISAPAKGNISGSISNGLAGYTQFSAEEKASFITGKWYVLVQTRKFSNGIMGGGITLAKR